MDTCIELSQIDEAALFERWQQHHDEQARDALAERYMPLARRLARRYVRSSEPFEDLVQVASLGLVKAIGRYEAERSNRFATYAVPTILGELRRHFRDAGWTVHVPRGTQERALLVERAARELTGRNGRAPTVSELAQYTELDPEHVLDALQAADAYDPVSLDAPRPGHDGEMEPLVEALGDEDDRYELVESEAVVAAGFRLLSLRERRILYLRFVHELTQSEIAERVGVSQMQISRLLRRALARLRDYAEGAGGPRPAAATGTADRK
jgi:RNA polymerase sigma-B factor